MLRVRPAQHGAATVRHPVTRELLPTEGIVIADDDPNLSYWLRRQTDGDAIVSTIEGEE
jgi:hypothetical protein